MCVCVVSYSHSSSRQARVYMLLEVRVLGGQVGEVRWSVLVAVPRMHGLVQSHGPSPGPGPGVRTKHTQTGWSDSPNSFSY